MVAGGFMRRVRSGIYGLDELMEGGFPAERSILLTGSCGTGKTTFAMQYIYMGAAVYGEPGVYVTLHERASLIREDCLNFGWDIKKMEEQGMIHMIDGTIATIGRIAKEEFAIPSVGFDSDKLLLEIMRAVKLVGAKRVAIDSIPALGLSLQMGDEAIRNTLLKMTYLLQRAGTTTLFITEVDEDSKRFSKYGAEEYITDGVIVLHYMSVGTQTNRTLHIRKMRGTHHSEDLHPMEIIPGKGIVVRKIEEEL